ncbi:adenine deaminase [Algisphaera agarilytica]|uniref:Adenine deaminase n=1 Tax=Algisphaera agarilytica TaxID=1385975 RepID=A0A7X0H5S9_9BACT|nr:adenine deaminase [Algisphaera agarilytica]MBB6429577.1 adenine deaminase [Algisphaera agarilytica]
MPDHSFTLDTHLVDIPARAVRPATITVENGRIASIAPASVGLEPKGFVLPGFVDAHVHIESSMLTPAHFAAAAVVHGTVATVSDPHEIANVLGVPGVRYMLDNAATVPFKFAFGAPSCVPATTFETAGAALGVEDVTALLDDPRIFYLSEVMNFPGVLAGDADLLAMIAAAQRRGKPVDGHAPGLRGDDAKRYHAAGISTDHECFTKAEALDKLAAGATIQIREGSAARNFEALFPLIDEFPGRVMLCSDDKHPDELVHGHLDALVRRAVADGADVFNVLQAACITPVEHYGLPVGQLRVGDPADFIEVDSLTGFHVLRTFIDGVCVAQGRESKLEVKPAEAINRFDCSPKSTEDFAVPAEPGKSLRVIEAIDGQLVTHALELEPAVEDGAALADPPRDLLKIAVVNRYADAPPAVGFVTGFGLQRGAIAGSVGHDSHNIVAVGASDAELATAVNAVVEMRGGLSAVDGDRVETLPLPVAGLISLDPCDVVANAYESLDHLAKAMGSDLRAPYMTLSFMALLVIPSLKLSDRGLFDGESFGFADLWV